MKLYVHVRSTRAKDASRTLIIFKVSFNVYSPIMGHGVYTVHVDNKHDLWAIADQVDILVGHGTEVAVAAHLLRRQYASRLAS